MNSPEFPIVRRSSLIVLLLLMTAYSYAQLSGGGEANPSLHTNQQALQRWQNMRFGMFIHWGPVSLRGTEIGWSRGTKVPKHDYDSLYKEFNPVLFNAAEWVRIAKEAGMKYMVLVTKHHDGFCLWPSAYTDYDISATPYGKDIMQQLADECNKQGILFGTYYSILDWWNSLYPGNHGEPPKDNTKTDMIRYTRYLYHQVDELVNRYHTNILWFDGQWEKPWTHEAGMKLYTHLRELKDNLLINNRVDKGGNGEKGKSGKYAGDFLTPEQKIGTFDLVNPWESCITIARQWAWKPNDNVKSTKEIIHTLARTAGGNGNLLLNVSPMLDGRIERRQQKRLKETGDWLKKYGESIYGTLGGPYMPGDHMTSTRKNNRIYLHLLESPGRQLVLPSPGKAKVKEVRFLQGGALNYSRKKGDLVIELPETLPDPLDNVIVLELNKPAEDIAPIQMGKN
ncbi:MAG: alpha-L-fucosidase [Bacteroidales bacterium]|nr:alpha-L-fucosidase [Bacteroidales bacterium]